MHGTCHCNAKTVEESLLRDCAYCSAIALEAVAVSRQGLLPPQTPVQGCECAMCDILKRLPRYGVDTARRWWMHPDIEMLLDMANPFAEEAWCARNRELAMQKISALAIPPLEGWIMNPVQLKQNMRLRTGFVPEGEHGDCGKCQDCARQREFAWIERQELGRENQRRAARSGSHGKDLVACGDIEENPGPDITLQQVLTILDAYLAVARWMFTKLWRHRVFCFFQLSLLSIAVTMMNRLHNQRLDAVQHTAMAQCDNELSEMRERVGSMEQAVGTCVETRVALAAQAEALRKQLAKTATQAGYCHANLTYINMTYMQHMAECDVHYKNLSEQMTMSLVLKSSECEQQMSTLELKNRLLAENVASLQVTLDELNAQLHLLQTAYDERGILIGYVVVTGYCVSGVVLLAVTTLAIIQATTWLWLSVAWIVRKARWIHYSRQLALYDTEITVFVNSPYGNSLCRDLIERSCMEFRHGAMKNEASKEYCLRCFRFAELEVYGEDGAGTDVSLPRWQWNARHNCPILDRCKYTVPILAARYFHILLGAKLRAETGHRQMRGQKYGLFKWGQVEEYSPDDDPEFNKVVVQESGAERSTGDLPATDYGPSAPNITFDEALRTQHFVTPTRSRDPLELGAESWMTMYHSILRSNAYIQLLPVHGTYATDAPGGKDVGGVDHQYTQDRRRFFDRVYQLVKSAVARNKLPELPPFIAEQLDWWFHRMVNNDFEMRVRTAGQTGTLPVQKPKIRRLVSEYKKRLLQPDLQRIEPLLKQAVATADESEAEMLAKKAREMVEAGDVPPEILERVTLMMEDRPSTDSWADVMEQEDLAQQELILLVFEWLKQNQATSSNTRVEAIMRGIFLRAEGVQRPQYVHVRRCFRPWAPSVAEEMLQEVHQNTADTTARLLEETPASVPEAPSTKQSVCDVEVMTANRVDDNQEKMISEMQACVGKMTELFKAVQAELVRNSNDIRKIIARDETAKVRAKPEAQVPGSSSAPALSIVAAIADMHGRYISQGYLRNTSVGMDYLLFGTARHKYTEAGPVALVDGRLANNTKVYLRTPDAVEPYVAEIIAAHSPEGDEIWYLLKFGDRKPKVPKYDILKAQELLKMQVGSAVFAVPFIVRAGGFQQGVFEVIPGTLNGIANAKAITYQMSTNYGYCRMAVFAANGKMLCGHWDGNSPHVSPPRPGGSLCVAPPPNLKDWLVGPFSKEYYGGSGPQAILDHPLRKCSRQFVGYTEDQKVWRLRRDFGDFGGIATEYTLMRPSTAMNLLEIKQFAAPINVQELDWGRAASLLTQLESKLVAPVEPVTRQRVLDCVLAIGTQPKMAGPGRPLHEQFLVELGCGDYQQGVERVTDTIWHFIQATQKGELDAEARDFWNLMLKWTVFGKLDRYKKKKMNVGRTIQAPPFELKVLHLVYFEDKDSEWCCRMAAGEAAWVYAGHDFDMPVSEKRIRVYANAKAALALDMTAFDRRMTGEMISAHFEHLDTLYPGVPEMMYQFFYHVVVNTKLVLSDGSMWQKARGNPSGYPNTLRLNCSVNMMSWLLCIESLMGWQDLNPQRFLVMLYKHFHIEICGDDSRVWALTDVAADALKLADEWWNDNLPWETKVEGYTVFDRNKGFDCLLDAPPMVSRRFAIFKFGGDSYLFEPLMDVSRCLSRWLHDVERPPERQEEVELGVSTTVALLWYQTMVVGYVDSLLIRAFDKMATDKMKHNMRHRVGQIWAQGIPQVPFLQLC